MADGIDKAVVLAAGAGRRMRREDAAVRLTDAQSAVAAQGIKALVPIGRPFVDYVLYHLAEAGVTQVCLVVGPDHEALRDHCTVLGGRRLAIEFAVQAEPRGTADAVASAAEFAGDDEFLAINSDNLYPVDALRRLRQTDGPAAIGFDSATVFHPRQHSPERVAAMGVMQCDEAGYLRRILEKPPAEVLATLPRPIYVSMNCWRFSPAIFEACRGIPPSPRGEYELPGAVNCSVEQLGQRYRVIPSDGQVLDLSHRSDVADVAELLHDVEVDL